MKPMDIDYQMEAIQTRLDAGLDGALAEWQNLFEQARDQWQIERARRLLRLLKSQNIAPRILGLLKYHEATLLVNLGEWKQARKAFEQALAIRKESNDPQRELVVLNSLANLLRRNAETLDEAIDIFQAALNTPQAAGKSKVVILNGLGLSLYEKGDLEQAQAYFQEVLELSVQTQDQKLRASALHNLGSIAWTRGRLNDAHQLLEDARTIQTTIQDSHGESETLNSLGLVSEGLGEWENALNFYQQALKIMERLADFYGQAQVLVNLGNIYSLKGEAQSALACLEQARAIAGELGNPRLQGQALGALGDAYRMAGEFQNSEEFLLKAVELKTRSGEMRSLKHTWLSLGAVYQGQRQPDKARNAYKNALKIARLHADHRVEVAVLLNMGMIAAAENEQEKASSLFEQARDLGLEFGYHNSLAMIFEQIGDLELLRDEPAAAKILESFVLALWHANQFNEYELHQLIKRLENFWIANAQDGQTDVSIWFCESIIQLWKDAYPNEEHSLVIEEFGRLRKKLLEMGI